MTNRFQLTPRHVPDNIRWFSQYRPALSTRRHLHENLWTTTKL